MQDQKTQDIKIGSHVRHKKYSDIQGTVSKILDPLPNSWPKVEFVDTSKGDKALYSSSWENLEIIDQTIQTPENFDPEIGAKFDHNKPNWSLMPWEVLSQVQDIIDYGAKKYAPNNWKKVEPWRERYFSAVMRHLLAWHDGEKTDPESGKSHLAHAICSLLFMLWREGNT